MGDKEVKNKKGFMSRLSSFRKKKSSSKHGSASSLKSSSGENSGKGDSKRKMLSDVDRKSKTNSCVSSSQNSLEGLNGRTRSTSDLIAGFEKRLSQLKDEKVKTVAQPSKRSSETSSNSSLESERSSRGTAGVGTNADQNPASHTKGHLKTTAQSTVTSKSGIQPYRSVFNEGHNVLDNLEKTDDTTQTDFSQRSEGDDDVARLVKVQSTKTPETKRAHLSAARQNVDASGQGSGLNNKTIIIGKETFIGPDPFTPGRGVDVSQFRFQSTSTPMPKISDVILEPTNSPIGKSNDDSTTANLPHADGIGQLQGTGEMSISQIMRSSGNSTRRNRNVSGSSTQRELKRVEEDVWTKLDTSVDQSRMSADTLGDDKGMNATFTKNPLPQNNTMPVSQVASTSGNRTVVLEKAMRLPSKGSVGRTVSLESTGADSLCSDDLMCDSKFLPLEETTFLHSGVTTETQQPVKDGKRNRTGIQLRKGSEGDSISSSLPSSSSILSSSSMRGKLNAVEKDSCVVIDAVVYNSMVRELSAMRLMLRKLSTLLHEEKVVKTRSSEVQCDPMWNRCHQDSQTEISELMNSSSVSVASVQCNIHPEKLTCGSQYEKPRELSKPSRLATPTSKLTKPRTSQPSSKESRTTTQPSQVTESDQSEHAGEEEEAGDNNKVAEEEPVENDEKRDDMKGTEDSELPSVEVKVRDAHSPDLVKTVPLIDRNAEISKNTLKEMSKQSSQTYGNGGNTDKPKGREVTDRVGSPKIIEDEDNKCAPLQEEKESRVIRGSRPVRAAEESQENGSESQERKPEYLIDASKVDNSDNGENAIVKDDREAETGFEKSCKVDDGSLKRQEGDVGISRSQNGIPKLSKSGSSSKISRLQQLKGTGLRYSSQTVKTEKSSVTVSKVAKPPQGSLRSPQWSKTEKVSTTEYQSSLKSAGKPSEQLHRREDNPPQKSLQYQPAPTKRYPTNQDAAVPPKKAAIASVPVDGDSQGGLDGTRPAGVSQGSKLQRPQRAIPQSKLTAPSSYSNVTQKKTTERGRERGLSESSDGKSVDDNGNASPVGSTENINGNTRGIPVVSKTGGSRLPQAKSSSRLPRGRGIPRMSPR